MFLLLAFLTGVLIGYVGALASLRFA